MLTLALATRDLAHTRLYISIFKIVDALETLR